MYVSTHQLLVSTMYSTCATTKIPHHFHHPNLICISVIDLVYMITFLQMLTPKIAPSFWSGSMVDSMAIDSFLNSLLSLLAAKF
jgi:hypothetical protein